MTIEAILGIAGFFLLAILGIFNLVSRVRQQDMALLRGTNEDLRKSIDDKGKEIRDMKVQMQAMSDRLVGLENSNSTLEQLVKTALKEYFSNNPKTALGIKV